MANLNRNGTLVNKNWELIYDLDLYYELGFSLDDLSYRPSFEEKVSRHVPEKKDITENNKHHITVNHCPEFISSTILYLRGKHENIQTQANVGRHLSEAGIPILKRIPGLMEIRKKRNRAYEIGSEPDRLNFRSISRYDLRYRLSLTDLRMTVYTFPWVRSAIGEMAWDLSLAQEVIAIQALIGGMATSKKWIPCRYMSLIFDELVRFANWVHELSEKV